MAAFSSIVTYQNEKQQSINFILFIANKKYISLKKYKLRNIHNWNVADFFWPELLKFVNVKMAIENYLEYALAQKFILKKNSINRATNSYVLLPILRQTVIEREQMLWNEILQELWIAASVIRTTKRKMELFVALV